MNLNRLATLWPLQRGIRHLLSRDFGYVMLTNNGKALYVMSGSGGLYLSHMEVRPIGTNVSHYGTDSYFTNGVVIPHGVHPWCTGGVE